MSITPDGKYPITLASGAKVLADAVVTVDTSGTPVGGGGGPVGAFVIANLTDNGNDGDKQANKDYSTVAGRVYLTVPTGYRFDVYAIRMFYSWTGTAPTLTTNFGNRSTLTNGVQIESASGDGTSTIAELWNAGDLKTNYDWFLMSQNYQANSAAFGGAVKQCYQRILTSPLSVTAGTCIQAKFHDDLSSLTSLYFEVEGRVVQV